MEKASTKPHWTTAEMLRRNLLVRCAVYCEKTGTASSILSTHIAGAAKWVKGVQESADIMLATYDRAMRRLDALESMTPWPRLRIVTTQKAGNTIVMEHIVIRKAKAKTEGTDGQDKVKKAGSARRGGNKRTRRKGAAIRGADRKPDGRSRNRARRVNGEMSANS